jgi:hypothetical protein
VTQNKKKRETPARKVGGRETPVNGERQRWWWSEMEEDDWWSVVVVVVASPVVRVEGGGRRWRVCREGEGRIKSHRREKLRLD